MIFSSKIQKPPKPCMTTFQSISGLLSRFQKIFGLYQFSPTGMFLCLLAVIDPNQQHIVIIQKTPNILFFLDTPESMIYRTVVLQFQNDWDSFSVSGFKCKIGISLSCFVLPVDTIIIQCCQVSDGHHTCKRVFIAIRKEGDFFASVIILVLCHPKV